MVQLAQKLWRRARREALNLSDRGFDLAYGVSTRIEGFTLESRLLGERNHGNEGISYIAIRQILDRIPLREDDVFFDIGCGYGRALADAGRRRIVAAVGIELREEVAERGRANMALLKGRRCSIEVRQGDALQEHYGEASYIYMYNPFDAAVMRGVLDRIRADRRDRRTRIVYANPTANEVLEQSDWLEACDRFSAPYQGTSMPVTAWVSR